MKGLKLIIADPESEKSQFIARGRAKNSLLYSDLFWNINWFFILILAAIIYNKLFIKIVQYLQNLKMHFFPENTKIVVVAHDWIVECIGMFSLVSIPPYILGQANNRQIEASGITAALLAETQQIIQDGNDDSFFGF